MRKKTATIAELVGDRLDHLRGDITNVQRLVMLQTLRRNLDQLEQGIVADCRAECVTWDQIGSALDVTRQAAQQRFGR